MVKLKNLDIGNGKVEELISYNQVLEHLENAQDHDMGMDQELFRFRAIIGHQGPLLASDPDWKGSKYNVQVEWETGEITFEPHLTEKYPSYFPWYLVVVVLISLAVLKSD